MRKLVSCNIFGDGLVDFVFVGKSAEYISKKIKENGTVDTDDFDNAIIISIEEGDAQTEVLIKDTKKFTTNNDISSKAMKKAHVERLKKAGKKLLELKAKIDEDYGIDSKDLIAGPLADILENDIGIKRNSAKRCMYLAIYQIEEKYFFLGSDLLTSFIENCKTENCDDVNELLDRTINHNKQLKELEDEDEIKKSLIHIIEKDKFLKKCESKKIKIHCNDMVDDLYDTGQVLKEEHMNNLRNLNNKNDQKSYLEKLIITGQTTDKKKMTKRKESFNNLMEKTNERAVDLLQNGETENFSIECAKKLKQSITQLIEKYENKTKSENGVMLDEHVI